jgi:ketol-acid reductoisomerase
VLKEVRAGAFARELRNEEKSGYARLEAKRESDRRSLLEQVFTRLHPRD